MSLAPLEKLGDLLATFLEHGSSRETIKLFVESTGYNDSPFFGAEKKKIRFVGELVMANTALLIFAVNQVSGPADAKTIIDTFLATARKSMFSVLEGRDPTFKRRYEQRLNEYFKILSNDRPMAGMTGCSVMEVALDLEGNAKGMSGLASSFMRNLGLDPIKNSGGKATITMHLGNYLGANVFSLRRLLMLGEPSRTSPEKQQRLEPPRGPADPDQHISRSTGGFVGMMDVDNFDLINDRLGRAAGDHVMKVYKRLTASIVKTTVILSEDGYRAFHAQALASGAPLSPADSVLCFPYSSGDEFLIHHRDIERVCELLVGIQRAADESEIPIVDATGRSVAVLHGIPISTGYGPSWKEAWRALLAQKKARLTRGMEQRIELMPSPKPEVRNATTESSSSPLPPEDLQKAAAKIFRDSPQTDQKTGLPTTLDIVSETTPEGLIPTLMWGPVETRRPGWTKAHQEKMYRGIFEHMRALGIVDIEVIKKTAHEVSVLTDQAWSTTVRAMVVRK